MAKRKTATKKKASRGAGNEARETRLLVRHGFDLARELETTKVLVLSELITDRRLVERHRQKESIIWVAPDREALEAELQEGDHCIEIPDSPSGRVGQVTIALVSAVFLGVLKEDDTVVCLVGLAGSKRLDNILIANPKRDFSWAVGRVDGPEGEVLGSQAFVRLVEVALKFASEGREGKPIGTMFLLGDIPEMEKMGKPLILNPCRGHPRKARSIFDREFLETLRELAALDGAFLVDRKGVVERAGVYIDAPVRRKVKVRKGFGARHVAAAAASAQARCVAVVISESSGTVTVFFDGREVMSLARPKR